MALPKKNRLTSKKEIDHIFKNGRTVKGSFLFIKLLDNPRGYSRFAFIVPSKYAPLAVDRNRTKRALSEEVRRTPILSGKSHDVIVSVFKKITKSELDSLTRELRELLSKV
ncbi:MAG: ribonuclease P protein component [Candidatus Staskawiczbacteria bacterium RIFCSPLOWO2_12_FULL_37_15]|uniref:Ribonuclease P protein component n=1 Tax=Candidatus Staskawiczbacteria bacterium RIFCSPLOWO2_12_FULL_37_15 TaxID=1802218 RepID=A0A1G2IMG5_9BACT|nr:MAG: ribonuclease P protein component [Candidatus Staskawiczbacteria bacterium RIFCSPLOWO2_12_FULL_37_15]